MLRLLVERDLLERLVRRVKDCAAGRLVHAAAFHSDKAVFNHIDDTDAVFAAQVVELFDNLRRGHLLAVHRDRHALFKADRDIRRRVGGLLRRNAHLQDLVVIRLVGGVLQIKPFVGQVPQVFVLGIVRFAADLQRNVVLLGVCDFLFAAVQLPETPRRDDIHIRSERLNGQFKANLIVALSGTAVRNRVGALLFSDFNKTLCNDRPGE